MTEHVPKRFVARGIMTWTDSGKGLQIEWHDKSRTWILKIYGIPGEVHRVLHHEQKQAVWSALEEDDNDPKEDIVYRLQSTE